MNKVDARINFKYIFMHPKYGFRPYTRHSFVLMIGGLAYLIMGFVIMGWTIEGPQGTAVAVALRVIPAHLWGLIWMSTGALVIFSAWWPAQNDRWGYAALTALAGGWAAIYLAGLFSESNSFAEITGALVWSLVAFLWWGIAGLVNPEDIVIAIEPLEETNGDGA